MSRHEAVGTEADSPPGLALASTPAVGTTKPAVLEFSSAEWGRLMVARGYPGLPRAPIARLDHPASGRIL